MEKPKVNVLYISYDGMTDSLGQSQVLPYLSGLSKRFNFHLISFEKADNFRQHEQTIRQNCLNNDITWHPLSYTKHPPILSTVYDVYKLFKLAKELDNTHDFKIIHCRSYISAFIGLSFKKKRHKKFVFDMRGFWADERVDGKIWDLKNPIYKTIYNYFKKKEKQYFTHSDAIVSLTENGKQEILSWELENVTDEKITVIPCCVNTNLFSEENIVSEKKDALKKRLNINDADFILGYVGSIGTWYMLPEMLEYFKRLSERKQTAKFLFVSGDNPQMITDLAKEKGIDTAQIIIEKCLHKEVPTYISLFDQSIFFILPVYSKKASSPTKQGEIMAMGIPVVCNAGVGDTDLVVKKYKSGVIIESFNDKDYKEAVEQSLTIQFEPERMQFGATDFYGLTNGIESYLSIYNKLLNS